MSQELLSYKGLYGDPQPTFLTDFIHLEPLAVRSKIYAWEINEHIHTDLLQIFIIEKGEGRLHSEKKEFPITGPSVLIIPANILHGFTFEADILGEVLTVSESYLYTLCKDKPILLEALKHLEVLNLPSESPIFTDFCYWKDKIQEELFGEYTAKQLAMQSYFQLFLLEVVRFRTTHAQPEIAHENRALAYFRQFQQLIRETAQKPLTIKAYADRLHITQTHLNRICHTVAQTTALNVVQDFMVNEAKKYLLNTSYAISEIAYFLNFNDPAYFGRLFKKKVGVSPGEFRRG